ncbi:hypothetical protein T03_7605 [Trichinella britovi]|uniref:Uncharacterized protein n=1 Tax=Trichinella britovi TaxID=45882 RepID=A0A0V0YVK5_TRIBR|nr:hypothetical protein T03_7605 [Trichinella britovi]
MAPWPIARPRETHMFTALPEHAHLSVTNLSSCLEHV